MDSSSPPDRVPPRTVAKWARGIFVPLFAILLFFAYSFRVMPMTGNFPQDGTLPNWVAVVAALITAAGVAVLTSLLVANIGRLRAVLRPRTGKVLTALVLAAIMPVAFFDWMPVVPGAMVVMMLTDYYEGWVLWLAGLLALMILTYPISALAISGIRAKRTRFAVFALIWWTAYFGQLLAFGFRNSGL